MKDGRPSRIIDIRYFFGDSHLKGQEDAVAFGRRLAWLLNGEDFSLGAYHSLYISLTPSLPAGSVQVTDRGGDWWQRYTNVGIPKDFQERQDAAEIVVNSTVSALKAIRPDCHAIIDYAEKTVRSYRDELRFLLKARQTKKFIAEVSSTIAPWPKSSQFFVSLTDRTSGDFLEAAPLPLKFYDNAFDLAGSVTVDDNGVSVLAHKSFTAGMTAALNGGPLVRSLPEFSPTARPCFSKQVTRP